jgi:[FeFe] hydrogenase H-cluster maturation GTPase HydF
MMQTTPKSLRLQIALLGRTNSGKSTLLNMLAGQDVAITSEHPGTTTDIVEKPMELLPVGPVVFLDTAGLDDTSPLGPSRIARSLAVLDRADIVVLVTDSSGIVSAEEQLIASARQRKLPIITMVNKTDLRSPSSALLDTLRAAGDALITGSAILSDQRERLIREFKSALLLLLPESFVTPRALIGDLIPGGGLVVMVVPIDLQAPQGRLILPQVQTLRDILDHDGGALVVKEREYRHFLQCLTIRPALVICDSQVILKTIADTPPDVPCTGFSILFARLKGDLQAYAAGAATIRRLQDGDRVLIAESCTHHALEDDIGRIKIPRWLRQFTGADLVFEHSAGRDFPANLADFRLVVQCGGCMQNRREILARIGKAQQARVAITNYGICIAETQGVLSRALAPFPAARQAYLHELTRQKDAGFTAKEDIS